MSRIRGHDWSVLEDPEALGTGALEAVRREIRTLDAEARRLAVACLAAIGPPAALDLLALCTDPEPQVRSDAADALRDVARPTDVAALANAAVGSRDALVRYLLYMAIGRAGRAEDLPALRSAAGIERDPRALRAAQAAATRLGAPEERRALAQWLGVLDADDAPWASEVVCSTGDVRLARALRPWLQRQEAVTRVGADAAQRMARMCDVAVWIAHRLGVPLPDTVEALDVYPDALIAATAAALEMLPSP